MKKILHVVGSLDKSTGGPSRSVPQSCEQLSALGLKIELFARPSDSPVEIKTSQNLNVKFYSMKQLFLFGKSLSKNNFDLIHLQHVWDPYLHIIAWWARKKRVPYIITPRGMLEPWILKQRPWKKKIGLLLYQHLDIKKAVLIHATCDLEKQNIINLGYKNPITIIPNGVDLSEVVEVKKEYGTKKIIFLSRIHPKKGIELLVEAWRQIETKGWKLEIAGNGEKTYIETLKESAKDIKNIEFVGAVFGEAKWNFIRSADIMVLPTYSENFGIVVAEALAVGVPVITTKGTPWEELNTHNCGWWIDLSTSELEKVLAKAMLTSIDDIKVMGQNGINLIAQKYDIRAVAKEIKKMYEDILK